MRADLPHRLLLVLACASGMALAQRPAHAEEAPSEAKDPEGTYAGKDAAWWIGELADPQMHDGAMQALQLLGTHAAPDLGRALGSGNPAVRLAAAVLLRKLGESASVPGEILARGLEEDKDGANLQALLLLVPHAPLSSRLVEGLLHQVNSADPRIRRSACAVLGGLKLQPSQVPPALEALLTSGDMDQATAALRALTSMAGGAQAGVRAALAVLDREQEPDAQLVQEVRQVLARAGTHSAQVRGAFVRASTRWPGAAGAEALHGLVEQAPQDPATGTLLLEALRTGGPDHFQVARRLLEQGQVSVRASPGPLVRELLAAKDPGVRRAMLYALSRTGSTEPEVFRELARLLQATPSDPEVASALPAVLLGAPLPEVLEVAVTLPPEMRTQLGYALMSRARAGAGKTSESSQVLALLESWLDAPVALPPRELAGWLQQGFAGVRDPAAIQVLTRLLGHADAQLATAASACLNMSNEGIAARLALLRSASVEVRRAALRGARVPRGPGATAQEHAALLAALEDVDAQVRAGATRWLATWNGWSYASANWPPPPAQLRAMAQGAIDLFEQGDPADRWIAVDVYVRAQVPRKEMLPLLRGLLGDPSNSVQPTTLARAFALTSEWVEAPAVAELIEDLASPEMLRRADAALVLASLRQQEARVRAALPTLVAHASPRVVRHGIAIAALLGPVAADLAPALRRMIDADQPQGIGPEAAAALVAVDPGSLQTLADLRRWLRGGTPLLRHSLPGILARMGTAGVPVLVEGLDLGSPLAETCLWALQQMGGDARDALPALRERALKRPDDKALAALIASLERG